MQKSYVLTCPQCSPPKTKRIVRVMHEKQADQTDHLPLPLSRDVNEDYWKVEGESGNTIQANDSGPSIDKIVTSLNVRCSSCKYPFTGSET